MVHATPHCLLLFGKTATSAGFIEAHIRACRSSISAADYSHVKKRMKRSDSTIAILIFIAFIFVLWKIFILHGDAITSFDGDVYRGIDKAAFSLYSSDTAQVQLLASHALWYSGLDSKNDTIDNSRAMNSDNYHIDLMWLNLVKEDFTLKSFAKKCSAELSSKLTEKIEILYVGDIEWTQKNNIIFDLNKPILHTTMTDCPKVTTTENRWSDPVHCVNMYNASKAFKTLLSSLSFRDAEYVKNLCHSSDYSIIVDNAYKLDEKGFDIVIIGDCGSPYEISFSTVDISNIYMFYDQVIAKVYHYRIAYPKSIIAWSKPRFHDHTDSEVKVLHNYLIMKHLIHDNGIVVIQPEYRFTYNEGSNNTSLLDIIKILERQVRCLLNFHESGAGGLKILANLEGDYEDNWKHKVSTLAEDLSEDYNYRDCSYHKSTSDKWLHPMCSVVINSMKFDSKCLPHPKELFPLLVTGLGGSGSHSIANELKNRGLKIGHESIDVDGSVSWMYAVNDVFLKKDFPHHAKELNSKLMKYNGLMKRSIFSPRFHKVIHVVRCPLLHISSFTSHLSDSYAFIQALYESKATHVVSTKQNSAHFIIDTHNQSLKQKFDFQKYRYNFNSKCKRGDSCNLAFSTLSWLIWNNHIDKYADITFKIENSTALIDYICTYLSHKFSHAKCSPAGTEFRNWFKGSTHHKVHKEYRLSNIALSTPDLVEGVLYQAKLYGYTNKKSNHESNYNQQINFCTY